MKIEKKLKRKTNIFLKKEIIKMKKINPEVAVLLARPKRKRIVVNIEKLNKESKPGDIVIVPGKVLGKGNMQYNIKIAAFSFSEKAREKLQNMIISLEEAARKNAKIIK